MLGKRPLRGLSVSTEKSSPASHWVQKYFEGAASLGNWSRKLCLAGPVSLFPPAGQLSNDFFFKEKKEKGGGLIKKLCD